ncbi:hypothetical protein [Halobaculum marinum]|uniref:CARDB protein n=1 Tax=Halobaculum marinum TaxID=3031996 RepID=A0ABD5WVX6_9EURY|nr:hypothetical protein [Halobaculum sp. DT55]
MARRTLKLVLLAVVVTGLSVGSAGFGSVAADRTVNVAVVDDEHAYVGVVACEKGNDGPGSGTAPVRVRVTNRYSTTLTVDRITSADADRTDGVHVDEGSVNVGNREAFDVVFEDDVATVTVAVTADGFDATITNSVATKADCPLSSGSEGASSTNSST